MLRLLLLVALLVQAVLGQSQCGPAQCYPSTCADGRPQVDIVFMIDISGSMAPKIAGVRDGFTSFAQSLSNKQLDVKFAIVTFGGDGSNSGQSPAVVQAFTSDTAAFTNKLSAITNVNGGWEAGLETIRTALNTGSAGNLNLAYRSGTNTKRVYILVSDEDSDPATISANNYQGHTTRDGLCRGSAAGSTASITDISDSTWSSSWQPEVSRVYNDLAAVNPNLYMFVAGIRTVQQTNIPSNQRLDPKQTCNTYFQYCNPDSGMQSQNADYSGFNSATTLSNLKNLQKYNGRSFENSLQGLFLANGRLARCFDVIDSKDSNLIKNFFSQIVSDISACNTCNDYLCSGSNCLAPVNVCGCDGVRNSGKVKDSKGNCCLPSEKDCAGICQGTANYDACGVCTPGGTTSSYCIKDCNNNYYLNLPANPTSLAAYSTLIYKTTCPNVAGYLLQNTDILNNVYKVKQTTQSVCDHFHTYGRFEGRNYCTLDSAAYVALYPSVSAANAESDWLASLLTASPKTATCAANSRRKSPPLSTDSCGQCIVSLDQPPYCVKDCAGVFRKLADPASFTDNCGYCVAFGTNPNARKDDCGVCNGGNAAKNECGVCNGPRGTDGCNQLVCQNLTCTKDCDGVSRNPLKKQVDECKVCVFIVDVRDPTCKKDCTGTWFLNSTATSSPNIIDECGNCVPRAQVRLDTCKQDCNKVWGGSSTLDNCGQCVVNGKTPFVCSQDCRPVYYRVNSTDAYYKIDDCGLCNSLKDQNSDKDLCGICRSTPGYNTTADCTPDCKGQWLPTNSPNRAFVDFCKNCWFANETSKNNYFLDNCGVCHTSRSDPSWNAISSYDDLGNPCACGVVPVACVTGIKVCVDTCPNVTCTSRDSCYRCPGDAGYGTPRDDCGKCCNATALPGDPTRCNSDKDSCGICFGYDKNRNNPCNVCDPWFAYKNSTLCLPDCKGTYNGNATYGCDGICGSTATCVNSTVPPVESNTGAIIGGVIGGVVALVALILAVLFAVKYAHSAGLFGMSNKQVDFGASNQNPLYKTETSVHQNPLYAQGS